MRVGLNQFDRPSVGPVGVGLNRGPSQPREIARIFQAIRQRAKGRSDRPSNPDRPCGAWWDGSVRGSIDPGHRTYPQGPLATRRYYFPKAFPMAKGTVATCNSLYL
jgi:hypothetical protein